MELIAWKEQNNTLLSQTLNATTAIQIDLTLNLSIMGSLGRTKDGRETLVSAGALSQLSL